MTLKQSLKKLLSVVLLFLFAIVLIACRSETSEEISAGAGASISEDGKINLNNMTREQLEETIPDFSGRMVREFFEYQPYISVQQFRREIGKYVDEAQVADYEQYIFVPIDVDESDQETIMQIPSVDAALAQQLLAARPFGSNDAFLALLGESLSAEQVAVAATYLRE